MNAIAQVFARNRTPAESGFVASHYRYFRKRRGMTAARALAQARLLPATYCAGMEYYGDTGGAGAPFNIGGTLCRWIENTGAMGLREVGRAEDIAGLRHSGWYNAPDGDGGLLEGRVWQFPARNGESVLAYGYVELEGREETNPGSACIALDLVRVPMRGEYSLTDSMDGTRVAATWADGLAEHVAESERDYREAYNRGAKAATRDAMARNGRRTLRSLTREARVLRKAPVAGNIPAVLKALAKRIAALRDAVERNRDKRDSAWSDCPRCHESAWLDGFMDTARGNGFVRAVRLGWMKPEDWKGPADANPAARGPLHKAMRN